MKALIFGISGQDGSYLAEYLLSLGYEVYGTLRRHSVAENQQNRLDDISSKVHTMYGDLLDQSSIDHAIQTAQPDEIYNLAAMSHVKISFEMPQFTTMTNALGVLNVLESVRKNWPKARVYQASSSEQFGNCVDEDGKQRETTPMHPVSPYGCSKLFAYSLMRNYRHAYNMFAVNGILFNHESPRRGSNFVSNKIVKQAVLIKLGLEKKLALGNMDSYRDWGHAYDYVRAMHTMMQHDVADDFVVATGETHTVREFCETTFGKLGLDYHDYVVQEARFMRPEELKYLCGDSTKMRETFGWKPTYTFESMVEEMIAAWMQQFSKS